MIAVLKVSTRTIANNGVHWTKPEHLRPGERLKLTLTCELEGDTVRGTVMLNIDQVAKVECDWPSKEEWEAGWFTYPIVLGAIDDDSRQKETPASSSRS